MFETRWQIVKPLEMKLPDGLRDRLANAMGKVAADGERYAKERITDYQAVDTGFLRNSQAHEHEPGSLEAKLASGAEYSIYINYGTRFMAARPFFSETVQMLRQQLAALLAAAAKG